jgi:hypothetical protein
VVDIDDSVSTAAKQVKVEVDRERIHERALDELDAYVASDARLTRMLVERRRVNMISFVDSPVSLISVNPRTIVRGSGYVRSASQRSQRVCGPGQYSGMTADKNRWFPCPKLPCPNPSSPLHPTRAGPAGAQVRRPAQTAIMWLTTSRPDSSSGSPRRSQRSSCCSLVAPSWSAISVEPGPPTRSTEGGAAGRRIGPGVRDGRSPPPLDHPHATRRRRAGRDRQPPKAWWRLPAGPDTEPPHRPARPTVMLWARPPIAASSAPRPG